MKKILLFLLVALFSNASFAQTLMPLPPHASVYTPTIRGYWFTAPVDFTIVGLRVPSQAGTGLQYMEVIKIHDAVPVVYATTSTNYTSLVYIKGATNGVIQTVSIPIKAGDKVGVFGSADLAGSYGTVTGPSSIDGIPVTIARILNQANITTGPLANYSTEPSSSSISRVELYYTTSAPCDDTLESSVVLGPKNICPGKAFNLRIGLAGGLNISGLTYQWEYSNNGISWANFTGVPNPTNGEISDVITKDRWYRCRVTCTATGNTYTTPAHKVSIAPFYYCYCDDSVAVGTGADIGRVNIIYQAKDTILKTGNPLPIYTNAQANRKYTPYHDSISWPCLYQDSSYRFVVSQINSTASLTSTYVQGYIDFDRDGLYNPNTEKIFNKRLDGTGTPPEQITAQVKIPSTSKIGPTGMRIIMSIDSIQSAPCDPATAGEGEVEDYIVNLCYQPCDGPTNAGIVSSTDTSMCNGYEYTLTDTTYERQRSGFTRSWQISGDDRSWFDINNSTNKDTLERSFTGQPLYYRLRLICPGSDDTTFSPSTLVNIKPGYKCYCYSKAIGGKESDSSDIGGISINGFVSNSGGPHLLNATANRPRTDHTDMTELNEMYLDSTYEFSVYHTMNVQEHGDAKVTVFMDFNNNKQYDIPQERIFTGYTSIGYHTLIDNVTIPNIAITDVPTGMRFILNNNVGPNVPSDEACGPYTSGETEDFLVIFRKKVAEGIGSIGGLTGFGLYPNPSTGVVHVNFNTSVKMEELTIRVTNVTGQEVYKNTYEHKGGMFDQQIDLGSQAKGIYLVELQSGGQRLLQKLTVR